MKKQTITAINSLMIAAFLLVLSACQKPPGADNKNTGNANSTAPVSNANSANSGSGENSNAGKSVSNNNAGEKTSGEDSASEKKSDEKLAQRIIGLWEGKSPTGEKIGLDFRTDNKVYPVGSSKKDEDKPAQYKVVDEETVELTTPDEKPETWTIKVNGDKMVINADTAKLEFTKAK